MTRKHSTNSSLLRISVRTRFVSRAHNLKEAVNVNVGRCDVAKKTAKKKIKFKAKGEKCSGKLLRRQQEGAESYWASQSSVPRPSAWRDNREHLPKATRSSQPETETFFFALRGVKRNAVAARTFKTCFIATRYHLTWVGEEGRKANLMEINIFMRKVAGRKENFPFCLLRDGTFFLW